VGLLRLCLALSVACFHFELLPGLQLPDGATAVNAFFVISGFLIALVMERHYAGRLGDFWKARLLRIFPPYWALLLCSVAYTFVLLLWLGVQSRLWQAWIQAGLDIKGWIFLGASNLSLLGMDWSPALNAHGLAWDLLEPAPHAWSLSVELLFYALAPWMLRFKDPVLALAALASLAYKVFAPQSWFFPGPALLGYFCLGILAWRHRQALSLALPNWMPWIMPGLLLGLLWLLPLSFRPLALPLAVALLLPSLLPLSGPLDRWMGESSYELYLVHPLAGEILAPFVSQGQRGTLIPWCLAWAALLWFLVERPLQAKKLSLRNRA
jgi:peptidoglycan/LPS O-acetylase OafA/YrhL